jgi:hypothetical protein
MRWKLGKGRAAGKNPDRKHDVLCNSSLFRFSPVAVFGKKTDPEGD